MSTVTDPIADLLARVRNAANAQKPEMFVPYSENQSGDRAHFEGRRLHRRLSVDTEAAHPRIKITNKLVDRTSAITGLKRVSRPGLRRYVGAEEIPRVLGGMGVSIPLDAARDSVRAGGEKNKTWEASCWLYIW